MDRHLGQRALGGQVIRTVQQAGEDAAQGHVRKWEPCTRSSAAAFSMSWCMERNRKISATTQSRIARSRAREYPVLTARREAQGQKNEQGCVGLFAGHVQQAGQGIVID